MENTLLVSLEDLKAERTWLIQHFSDEVRSLVLHGKRTLLSATLEVDAAIAEISKEIAKQENTKGGAS